MKIQSHWSSYLINTLSFILIIWSIKVAEQYWALDLKFMATFPKEISGMLGIVTSHFIHSDWNHLLGNSFALLVLGVLHAYGYPNSKYKTWLIIMLVAGIGVWLFGRPSYHLGASSITSGLFYFLLLGGILRRDKKSLGLMLIAVFMFGSILLGVLPLDPKISYEAHFFGAVGGVISAIIFRQVDPKSKPKIYEWEQEGYSVEDEGEYWQIGYEEKKRKEFEVLLKLMQEEKGIDKENDEEPRLH